MLLLSLCDRLVGATSLAKASLGNTVWATLLLNGSCGLPMLQLKGIGVSEYYSNGPGSEKWKKAMEAAEEEAREAKAIEENRRKAAEDIYTGRRSARAGAAPATGVALLFCDCREGWRGSR